MPRSPLDPHAHARERLRRRHDKGVVFEESASVGVKGERFGQPLHLRDESGDDASVIQRPERAQFDGARGPNN